MEQFLAIIEKTVLFEGFSREETLAIFAWLAPGTRFYRKEETLLHTGDEMIEIGIVLKGEIEAFKLTMGGKQFTVSRMGPGGVFGDVLSGSQNKSPVTLSARTDCEILFLSSERFLYSSFCDADLHRRLLANLVRDISDKYFSLDKRVDLLLTNGLRRRITTYLLREAKKAGSDLFTIPYNRSQLANYLGCERSALSRELSRMVAEQLIETDRFRFRLLRPTLLQQYCNAEGFPV